MYFKIKTFLLLASCAFTFGIYAQSVPAPPLPETSTNTCGPRTLTFPANAGSTVWYWQGTLQNGRSTSNPITGPVTVSVTGTYYINASNNTAWSADVPIVVNIDPVDLAVSNYINTVEQATHSVILKPGFVVPPGRPFSARVAINSECNDYVNWTEQIIYDENGQPALRNRLYFDGLSNALQNQSLDIVTGKVWVSQPLYDNLGKASASSLSAPILENDFLYKNKFITSSISPPVKAYSTDDFDKPINTGAAGEVNNPNAVGTDPGTLGWYYSSNNNLEPLTPVTGIPYSRSYSAPGPNPVIGKFAGVGNQNKMGSTHEVITEKQKIVAADLQHYIALKSYFVPITNSTTNIISADPDAGSISLFNTNGDVTPTAVTQYGETYVKVVTNQATSTPGIWPIGFIYAVTPGSSYTFRVKGYRSTARNVYLYVRNDVSGPNLLWFGALLPQGSTNEAWIQSTFTIPAGVTNISVGILWDANPVIGDSFYLNKLELYRVGGDVPSGYKFITTTPDNKKTVSFIDADGHELATALLTGSTYSNWSYKYYNDIGQLVASVAPNGVNTASTAMPKFVTTYKYDYLGHLIETSSPDEGTSQFVYSFDGKLRFSQNSIQRSSTPQRFSYANYDYLGRLIESGEYISQVTGTNPNPYVFQPQTGAAPTPYSILNLIEDIGFINLSYKVTAQSNSCLDYNFIEYDNHGSGFVAQGNHTTQTNTFGEITKTENANASTWYSYDEFGQLMWTMQNIVGLGTKTIDYTYDYYGNITQVSYQQGVSGDQFDHYYTYDVDQRLVNVQTSADGGATKTTQAKYYYYLHGPVKRVELGGNIQGIDYAYNIDGSLKLINNADPNLDPGQDGISNSFMKDIFGETLDYNASDYVGAGYNEGDLTLNTTTYPEQFSGILRSARWHTAVDGNLSTSAYAFQYDKVNQLDNADWGSVTGTVGNYTFTPSPLQAYKEDVTGYDKNGNITGMVRKGKTGNSLANYSYVNSTTNNQLTQVNGGTNPINYQYNSIGQLTQQTEGNNTMKLTYNVYGLVKEVYNVVSGNSYLLETFTYDDRGDRICKTLYDGTGSATIVLKTFYVNDLSGNTLATYNNGTGSMKLTEMPIYGAGRIALYKPLVTTTFYEVADHLGNVRGVIGNPSPLTFTATMEDNGDANVTNQRVQEMAYFKNLASTAVSYSAAAMNHTLLSAYTPSQSAPLPSYAAYLKWNGDPSQKSVGPTISIKVEPGDKIDINVWEKFRTSGSTYSRPSGVVAAMASILTNSYVGGNDIPANINQIFQTGISSLVSTVDGNGNDPNGTPYAYVYYMLYDRSLNFITKGWSRVSATSGFPAGSEGVPSYYSNISIPTVTITEPGYIYVFVSNESDNTDVWFDDLQVKLQRSSIVAGADFYPFGLTMENREVTREDYRYGYQGQYAEKDKNTGWNEFELRMYDARIGRWLSVDPYGQFQSPYSAMGNQPNMVTDADGGCAECEALKAAGYNVLPHGVISIARSVVGDALASGGVLAGLSGTAFEYRNEVPSSSGLLHYESENLPRPTGVDAVVYPIPDTSPPPTNNIEPSAPSSSSMPSAEMIQDVAGIAGMIPGLNTVAGIVEASAAIYRGDYWGAGFAAFGAIPLAGVLIKGTKLAATALIKLRATRKVGMIAHANFYKVLKAKGWAANTRQWYSGRLLGPDGISPNGKFFLELKPKTASGIAKGKWQKKLYERFTGMHGRVVYYDPTTGKLLLPF